MKLYSNNNKISKYRIKKILHCFCDDLTAAQTSKIVGISRITINRWYHAFRVLIASLDDQDKFSGEVELDESYFGATRVKGMTGTPKTRQTIFHSSH